MTTYTEERGYRFSQAGSGALLFDVASDIFSDESQERIWGVAASLLERPSVLETVPGMNNLLVVYDPLSENPDHLTDAIDAAWQASLPGHAGGKIHTVPVRYGGDLGEDLIELASGLGLSPRAVVDIHASGVYRVAAIGAMPGFPYLSGLDPRLSTPRRSTPRARVPAGSILIGGAQTGILPATSPSGWHIIGQTDVELFDSARSAPALLAPGDTIKFTIAGFSE